MSIRLKKLPDQVIVITGASSGIGLATAEAAAEHRAKLVLAARSETALKGIVNRLAATGCEALAVTCDVSDRKQVEALAATAVQRFGRIDTWVNNAGIGIYGRLDEVSDEDHRRVFDVNYFGLVYGSLVALSHLKKSGGALINVGSEVSESAFPLLGSYVATKHAVKGFTDSLRIEIEEVDRAPVSITLIQPTAVDTPFPENAGNYLPTEPKLPDPKIEPRQVAEAILDAAQNPTRDRRVGTMAKISTTVAALFPGLGDKMAASQVGNITTGEPGRRHDGILRRSSEAVTDAAGRTTGVPAPK